MHYFLLHITPVSECFVFLFVENFHVQGMETSEEAREKAEAELLGAQKQTALWERRALSMGWKDGSGSGKSSQHPLEWTN